MGDNSKIDWTDATWNPIVGCSRVSSGCDHCYAIRDANRLGGNLNEKISGVYAGVTTRKASVGLDWTGVVRCLPERLEMPLRWKRPRRIFVNSQSDLFHPSVPDSFILQVFSIMERCPQHTFQILTKRPERMQAWVTEHARRIDNAELVDPESPQAFEGYLRRYRNVWLGTSVEDQDAADKRIPWLMKTPAAVTFLSCEPLLGQVDLYRIVAMEGPYIDWLRGEIREVNCGEEGLFARFKPLGWVIGGGESGPGARPMHPDWARSLRDQCVAANVPFLFKQWGEYGPEWPAPHGVMPGQRHMTYLGPGGSLVRWGKQLSGRELDGRVWDEFPTAVPQ